MESASILPAPEHRLPLILIILSVFLILRAIFIAIQTDLSPTFTGSKARVTREDVLNAQKIAEDTALTARNLYAEWVSNQ